MNINAITDNPVDLFKSSFSPEELHIPTSWENSITQIISDSRKQSFSTGTELLKHVENAANTRFSSNRSNLISNFTARTQSCSELFGSLIMCLVWLNAKKTFPKVLLSSGLYYFASPDGEITQVNSNKKRKLAASEKFDLFKSDDTIQFHFPDLIKHYFEEVCSEYIEHKNYKSLEKALSYMIAFDPREIKWFARRGLLLKRLGKFSEALSDLKRFISFCSYEEAPEAVKNALIELEGLNATNNFNEYSIH